MKNRVFMLLCVVLSATLTVWGGTKTSVTVNAPSAQGKVYVEKRGELNIVGEEQITQASASLEQSSGSFQFYTVYAKPEAGYAFKEWVNKSASGVSVIGIKYGQDANNQFTATDNPLNVRVPTNSNSKDVAAAVLEAVFVPAALRVTSNNYALGSAKIDKVENAVGDQVTVTAVFNTPHATWQTAAYQKHSRSVTFDGWYDEEGVCLSQEQKYTFTVNKTGVIEARFSREFVLKGDENGRIRGYFRMAPPFSENEKDKKFLCVTGDFTPSINTSSGTYVKAALQYNQVSYANNKEYGQSDAVYSDAGSVIYLTCSLEEAGKQDAVAAYTKVASNVIAEAQGVSTAKIVESVLKNGTPWLTPGCTQGYYMLYLVGGVTLQWSRNGNDDCVFVSKDHLELANNRDNGDFDIQPVDLAHVDTNYFGAYPSEEMSFDGGYWTSMYTSFPYECYEPDGVEAYVVKGVADEAGAKTATLTRLVSGIVPAATPVLLKCKGLTPKENRLIPLLPDDSRLEAAQADAEGNMLTGNYGLWTAADYTGRQKYDASTMRVFSVNADGNLGFYKLAANADGSAQELVPNRAYLDLGKIPAEVRNSASFAIAYDNGFSGIGSVSADTDFCDEDAEVEYHTLDGIKVTHPVKGNIYIKRKGAKVTKIVY